MRSGAESTRTPQVLLVGRRDAEVARLAAMLHECLGANAETVAVHSVDEAASTLELTTWDCVVFSVTDSLDPADVRRLTNGAGMTRAIPVVVIGDLAPASAGPLALRCGADDYLLWEGLSAARLSVAILFAIERSRLRIAERPILDPLTGLPNVLLFKDRLRVALARSERIGSDVAVVFVDLDQFKQINDRHGHLVGDAVLVEIGRRLRKTFRDSDTVARIGGDEFAIACEGSALRAHLGDLREKAAATFHAPVGTDAGRLAVGASVGMVWARHEADPDSVLARADAAMYDTKRVRQGRERLWAPDVAPAAEG